LYLTALRAADFGDVIVFDEQSPLPEVLSVVSHAKAIIGMHGSTLAPMIWAPKGVAVVEMLHAIPWLHWWATATALKHDYWLVPIDSARHDSATVVAPIELTLRTVRAALGLPAVNDTATAGSGDADSSESDTQAADEKEKAWREDAPADQEWKDKANSGDKETEEDKNALGDNEILEKVTQGESKQEETVKVEEEIKREEAAPQQMTEGVANQ
jgi:hypothetical protein